MKTKQVFTYLLWILLSLLVGIVYMRILLGPIDISSEGFRFLLSIFYLHGILYVGLVIGSIIALLFIFLDAFYLKRKLKNHSKSTSIRFVLLLIITVFVAIIHYVLEKVIDVI